MLHIMAQQLEMELPAGSHATSPDADTRQDTPRPVKQAAPAPATTHQRTAGKRRRTTKKRTPARQYWLISVATHQHRPVFADWRIGRWLAHEFHLADQKQWVESLAWVILPDQFQWLIAARDKPLAQLLQTVKSRSTINIHLHCNVDGSIWQDNHSARHLRKKDDAKSLARQIIASPRRAGLVENIGDYPLWDAVWL